VEGDFTARPLAFRDASIAHDQPPLATFAPRAEKASVRVNELVSAH
jgi:hypothetical protein